MLLPFLRQVYGLAGTARAMERKEQKMKLCIFCSKFDFQPYEQYWSDLTPGSPLSLSCFKGRWDANDFYNENDYRRAQLEAETCPDFSEVNLEMLGVQDDR